MTTRRFLRAYRNRTGHRLPRPGRHPTVAFVLALASLGGVPARAAIDIDMGVGTAIDCRQVSEQIARNWTVLKDFLAPGVEGVRRPRSRDFQCVDAHYTRGLVERGSRGGPRLRCFSHPEPGVAGVCCDSRVRSCAMYRARR